MKFIISAHTNKDNVFLIAAFCKPHDTIVRQRGKDLLDGKAKF